jgi:histidyl-tRNA synthetase
MKYANKIGAEYTLIIGESEILAGRAQLRNMKTGEQSEVELQSFTI